MLSLTVLLAQLVLIASLKERESMFTWLAKRLLPHFIGSSVVSLDKDKRYMLFMPKDTDYEKLREAIEPWRGKVDLVIVLTDRFNLIEF